MTEISGININTQGDISAVVAGGNISDRHGENNLEDITDKATNAINQLPASPPPEQEGIREVLDRLEQMIEADENLKAENKAEALEQVKVLAEASKNPEFEENRNTAESAIQRLRGMIAEVPKANNFSEACDTQLPQIESIFGLG